MFYQQVVKFIWGSVNSLSLHQWVGPETLMDHLRNMKERTPSMGTVNNCASAFLL